MFGLWLLFLAAPLPVIHEYPIRLSFQRLRCSFLCFAVATLVLPTSLIAPSIIIPCDPRTLS